MRNLLRFLSIGLCCSVLLLFSPGFSSGSAEPGSPEPEPTNVVTPAKSAILSVTTVPAVQDTTEQAPVPAIHAVTPVAQTLFTLTQLQQIVRFQQQKGNLISLSPAPSVYDLSRGKRRAHSVAYRSLKLSHPGAPPRTEQ